MLSQERIQRILSNLAYLLGEKLAWLGEKWEWVKEVITAFIEGYTNAAIIDVQ